MIKKILLITLTAIIVNGCALSAINVSNSRNNFDEKIDKIEAYLKTQNCRLIDMDKQFIIYPDYEHEYERSMEYLTKPVVNRFGVLLQANIMRTILTKGTVYLGIEVALPTGTDDVYSNPYEINKQPLKLIYDGNTIYMTKMQDFGRFLYGNISFIYSDMYIMKDIANAKEVKLEGRNNNGRKFTKTFTHDELNGFRHMIEVVENVYNILQGE